MASVLSLPVYRLYTAWQSCLIITNLLKQTKIQTTCKTFFESMVVRRWGRRQIVEVSKHVEAIAMFLLPPVRFKSVYGTGEKQVIYIKVTEYPIRTACDIGTNLTYVKRGIKNKSVP